MSIRLKKVKWENKNSYSYWDVLGYRYEVSRAEPDTDGKGWVAEHDTGYISSEPFTTKDKAKSACEQHALERIREAVEVGDDHIPEATKMIGWQDISTAPKDGTEVMAYFNGGGVMKVSWVNYLNELSGWCVTYNKMDYPVRYCDNPSHWMPLPKPPKEVHQ